MTIQEFIDNVDALYPNTFTDAEKIAWVNNFQKQYLRWLTAETIYSFDTVEDTALYSLPTGVSFDLVNALFIATTKGGVDSETVLYQYNYQGRNNVLTSN